MLIRSPCYQLLVTDLGRRTHSRTQTCGEAPNSSIWKIGISSFTIRGEQRTIGPTLALDGFSGPLCLTDEVTLDSVPYDGVSDGVAARSRLWSRSGQVIRAIHSSAPYRPVLTRLQQHRWRAHSWLSAKSRRTKTEATWLKCQLMGAVAQDPTCRMEVDCVKATG